MREPSIRTTTQPTKFWGFNKVQSTAVSLIDIHLKYIYTLADAGSGVTCGGSRRGPYRLDIRTYHYPS
jgi:hypothetical protein